MKAERAANWTKSNRVGLDMSEVAFVNWSSGGYNSVSGVVEVVLARNYFDQRTKWDNKLVTKYGINSQEGRRPRKTNDAFEFTSNVGHRTDTLSNWYYSAKFSYRTQYTYGYKYPNRDNPISKFMAPGYVFFGVGSEYGKRIDNLSVYLSPATYKGTFVLDQELANEGAFGVERAVTDDDGNILVEGKKHRSEMGILISSAHKTQLMDNINLTNSLNLYTEYFNSFGNIDVDWELNLDFKVNNYVLAKVGSHLRYDDDIKVTDVNTAGEQIVLGARTQWKQQLGIGVVVDF